MGYYSAQGRASYERKDYKYALAMFNKAVERSQSVDLLCNRAACHEKLGDLPSALKDAKKAMQLGKSNPAGYFRAGSILQAMEKKHVALQLYAHGLENVKHVGQGYEVSALQHPF